MLRNGPTMDSGAAPAWGSQYERSEAGGGSECEGPSANPQKCNAIARQRRLFPPGANIPDRGKH